MNINVSTYPIAFRYPMEITNATSRLNKPADPSSISQFDPLMRSAEQLIKLGNSLAGAHSKRSSDTAF